MFILSELKELLVQWSVHHVVVTEAVAIDLGCHAFMNPPGLIARPTTQNLVPFGASDANRQQFASSRFVSRSEVQSLSIVAETISLTAAACMLPRRILMSAETEKKSPNFPTPSLRS